MWPSVLSERLQSHANASSWLVDTTPLASCCRVLPSSGHKDSFWKRTWRPCSSLAVCRATPEGLTLERPQEVSSSAGTSRGQRRITMPEREMDRERDISRHNQALLRWLDEVAAELEPVDGQRLEEELQRTVEIALKVQAQRAERELEAKRCWGHGRDLS